MSNKDNKKNISAKTANEKIVIEINEGFNKKENFKTQEKIKTIDEVEKKWDMNDKIIELFVNNIEKDQKLRSRYARSLMIILGLELLALLTFFILKGSGVLNYSDTTFNIFVSGGIAEVFILVRVIVKYLFKDNLTDALKIILTNNNSYNTNSRRKVRDEKNNKKN